MTTKKYELTNEKIEHESKTLYRIRALRDFEDVKMGDLGGFVESEINLSQEGNCWIYDDSKVRGGSVITDHSIIKNDSIVDNSIVMNNSKVESSTIRYSIVDNSIIEDSTVMCSSKVENSTIECSEVLLVSNVDSSIVMNNSKVESSTVMCNSKVDYSEVKRSKVGANKSRFSNAKIESNADYIAIANIGSRNDTLTAYRCANGEIGVATGCFTGNIDEFVEAVKDKHKDNKYAKQYLAAINLIKLALNPGIKQ